jgi:hypothetical protein
MSDQRPRLLQLKMLLRDVHPAVWRRVRLADCLSIAELHRVIQLLMGWDDDHLHRFRIHGREYGIAYIGGPSFAEDAAAVPLSRFGFRSTERFLYEYDFTAGWQIEVRVERVIEAAPRENHGFPVCVAGRRACPPDGCGGPQAYAERRRDADGRRHPASGECRRCRRPERSRRALGVRARSVPPEGLRAVSRRRVLARRRQRGIAAGVHGSAGFSTIRMAIQVVLLDEAGGGREVHEIVRIDRGRLCPEALGLSLSEAKAITAITGGIQQVLAGAQVMEWQEDQRACLDCGRRRSLKGHHRIVYRTPFGTLRLDSERLRACRCAGPPRRSLSPLAELLGERNSPELLYLETKFALLASYGLTVRLMGELLPLDRPIGAERVRRHLFRVADTHEAELASVPTSIVPDKPTGPHNTPPDGPLFVGIDGGYVRGREQGWFEVIAGKSLVSFHRDGRMPGVVSLSSKLSTTSRVPGSPIRCVNRACSHSSKLSYYPMASTPCGACSRTSLRKPSICWTGSMSPCG